RQPGILIHQSCDKRLIERSPVDADAYRLVVFERNIDDRVKVVVMLATHADVARIDAVFIESGGAIRIVAKKNVSVVMEVADEGNVDVTIVQSMDNFSYCASRFARVDRYSNQFGSR